MQNVEKQKQWTKKERKRERKKRIEPIHTCYIKSSENLPKNVSIKWNVFEQKFHNVSQTVTCVCLRVWRFYLLFLLPNDFFLYIIVFVLCHFRWTRKECAFHLYRIWNFFSIITVQKWIGSTFCSQIVMEKRNECFSPHMLFYFCFEKIGGRDVKWTSYK